MLIKASVSFKVYFTAELNQKTSKTLQLL